MEICLKGGHIRLMWVLKKVFGERLSLVYLKICSFANFWYKNWACYKLKLY